MEGLVVPGGESSVIDKLARAFGMQEPVRAAITSGMPVYGTCAGMILLADRIENPIEGQQSFGGLDITVTRNAFGAQVDSFEAEIEVEGFETPVHAAFIRAPLVRTVGPRARPLATLPTGGVVAVQQDALLATAFHPEVSGETRFHDLFLDLVRAA